MLRVGLVEASPEAHEDGEKKVCWKTLPNRDAKKVELDEMVMREMRLKGIEPRKRTEHMREAPNYIGAISGSLSTRIQEQ